ncbi:hypothetical protein ATB98_26230 [Sinorhizobium saheli]|uniref:Uncharacterized protein n=1 Tax=Sinorhizobium saheli TaxID=36856 RepID=A0A178YCZ2_SINSA|nr:hypothetical protein ATB98_26230 [Sinorhizobium saheli]
MLGSRASASLVTAVAFDVLNILAATLFVQCNIDMEDMRIVQFPAVFQGWRMRWERVAVRAGTIIIILPVSDLTVPIWAAMVPLQCAFSL